MAENLELHKVVDDYIHKLEALHIGDLDGAMGTFVSGAFGELLRQVYRDALLTNCG